MRTQQNKRKCEQMVFTAVREWQRGKVTQNIAPSHTDPMHAAMFAARRRIFKSSRMLASKKGRRILYSSFQNNKNFIRTVLTSFQLFSD